MHKLLKLSTEKFNILLLFISWRLLLILVAFFSVRYIPLAYQDRFLGGGPIYFKLFPQLFSWANFDGEHYLSISIFGYKSLEQAFFPVFPMLISFFTKSFSANLLSSLISSTVVGLLISNISFILALCILFELIKLDFSKKISYLTIILILVFPTSFFFGALYSESLFLLLSVLSFYFARKEKWVLSAVFGLIASATRVFGILLLPALLIECYQQKIPLKKMFWLFTIPLGLGMYMIYQYITVGDPLAFYHLQKIIGEQHQTGIITLPQVYFRYLKIIMSINITNPIYQTVWLELLVGISFFLLPIYGYFKKVRLSYLFYAMLGFILPTIQGSFSSVPRYVIVLFPSFLVLAIFLSNLPKLLRIFLIIAFFLFLIAETAMFLRGYWVA